VIEAKLYLFVESVPPFVNSVRYITDLSAEKVTCKSEDFYESLKTEYFFKRDTVGDIKTKLGCGSSLILDLENKEVYRYDELDKIKLRSGPIRIAHKNVTNPREAQNRMVERIVNEVLRGGKKL